jgi:hypothetical protein
LLVFSDVEVQRLLSEEFIPVTGDDWYQRKKQGDEGKFYRKVVEQGPRKGNGTRQGHYVFTPKGSLLGYNNNRGLERRLSMMKDALEKWKNLPVQERFAEVAQDATGDERHQRILPQGGQIIKVYTRALDQKGDHFVALSDQEVGFQTAIDHLWLRQGELEEVESLIERGGGDFPDWFALRIARFHLRDNTRGEPEDWRVSELSEWDLKVDQHGNVSGSFLLQKEGKKLGYQGRIKGELSLENGQLKKFHWLVLGEQWGEGTFTRGARPGKTPLGQVFELVVEPRPSDMIPPQSIRWEQGYWEAHRH